MYYRHLETNKKEMDAYVEGQKYAARKRLDEVAAKRRQAKRMKKESAL